MMNIVRREDNMPDEFASTGNSRADQMIKANSIALSTDQLNNESPNVQSTLVQSSIPNTFAVGINSMPMSIANNGTQPMQDFSVINKGNESEGVNGSEGGMVSKAQPISGAPTGHLPRPLSVTELELTHADPELLKRNQLFLLHHASRCNPFFLTGRCTYVHCMTMKNVLGHMTNCKKGEECTLQLCYSSRKLIIHWKNCVRNDCPLCGSTKKTDRLPITMQHYKSGTSNE